MNFKMNIRKKFMIPTILLIVAGMGISATVSYVKSKQALSRALLSNIEQQTASTLTTLENWLQDRQLDLLSWKTDDLYVKALLTDSFVGKAARVSASEKLVNLLNAYGYYENIALADLDGNIVASSSDKVTGKIKVGDRDYFKAAMAGETFVSQAATSRSTGNPVFSVSVPMKNQDKIIGVLFGVVDISSFSKKFIDPVKVGESGFAFIFDQSGNILAHPDKTQIMKTDLNKLEFGKKMIDQKKGLIEFELDGIRKWAFFKTLDKLNWTVVVNVTEAEILTPIVNLRNINVAVTIVVLAIAGVVVFLLTSMVVNPINRVVAGLKDAAEGEGDLTKRIVVSSNDEVGDLAACFNKFVEKLQGIIQQITGGVDTLATSSTELSVISGQISQGIQNVSEKTNNLSSAAEEMSSNMANVAASMEQSASNTNIVAASAEEMSSTINEIAQNAEKARGISDNAAQKASSASSKMDELGIAANDIGKVIETITDISEQVNLLALNATIEAARAGDAGKGFAVVANEIKDLAKQTAAATQDIKDKIGAIQRTTSLTINEITEINTVINEVNSVVSNIAASVEEQSAATKEIAGNVSQTSTGIQEVNQNVNQSSNVISEISQDIANVNVTMNEISAGSSQVSVSAQELSTLSETLKKMVDQFKV